MIEKFVRNQKRHLITVLYEMQEQKDRETLEYIKAVEAKKAERLRNRIYICSS